MSKILVTGGAGYKGVVLTRHLADLGHKVTVFDNFMYGTDAVLSLVPRRNIEFVRKDIRSIEASDVKGFDFIYHLAGISGFPACDASPDAAVAINIDATEILVDLLGKDQVIVYASTGSIYGITEHPATEEVVPETFVSLYARTKYLGEEAVRRHANHVVFRWATIFGVSPRMRWELMPNDFVRRAVQERVLVLYSGHHHQMLLHIEDCARGYALVTDSTQEMVGQTFNMGHESMNPTKLGLAKVVAKVTGCKVIEASVGDPDKRDLVVDFSKIKKLWWEPHVTLEQGIEELLKLFKFYHAIEAYRVI